jgi:hypothetical protein
MKADGYLDYVITDIRLHAQLPTNPKPADRVIKRSFLTGKPQRTFRRIRKQDVHEESHTLDISLLLEDEIKKAQQYAASQGKRLRVHIPKTGINVYIAPDGLEKLRAVERQASSTLS